MKSGRKGHLSAAQPVEKGHLLVAFFLYRGREGGIMG